jgi:peptidoglycan/xylan/chitin deacetylase (PgdA/CDA1 family)
MVSVGLARAMSLRHRGLATGQFPILMYHGINNRFGDRHPYFETNTSPTVFRNHMQQLAAGGYEAISLASTLQDAPSHLRNGHPVAITFDDGYSDFYDEALPVLIGLKFKATMFMVTDFTSHKRLVKEGKQYMSWAEVRELPRYGVTIGSHTVSHGKLHLMSRMCIEEEVRRSKEILEDKIGVPVTWFSCPFAFPEHDRTFTQHLRECLQRHGYEAGVSTIIGTANARSDRYFLPRLPVNSFDDEDFLQAKLDNGYAWLHPLQYAKKACAARLANG